MMWILFLITLNRLADGVERSQLRISCVDCPQESRHLVVMVVIARVKTERRRKVFFRQTRITHPRIGLLIKYDRIQYGCTKNGRKGRLDQQQMKQHFLRKAKNLRPGISRKRDQPWRYENKSKDFDYSRLIDTVIQDGRKRFQQGKRRFWFSGLRQIDSSGEIVTGWRKRCLRIKFLDQFCTNSTVM